MKAAGTRFSIRLESLKRLPAVGAPEAAGNERLSKRPRRPVQDNASGRQLAAQSGATAAGDSDGDSTGDEQVAFNQSEELSVYEKKRLKNIQENAEFFASLNMLETAKMLWEVSGKGPRRQNTPKREKVKDSGEQRIVRRSQRLLMLKSTDSPEPELLIKTSEEQVCITSTYLRLGFVPSYLDGRGKVDSTRYQIADQFSGPLTMVAIEEKDSKKTEDLMKTWLEISQGKSRVKTKQPKELKTYKSSLKRMTIQESFVAKVTPKRVCALAIHPSEQRFLVAAGSTYGYIGIWDLSSRVNDVVAVGQFKPHCSSINCLHFSPANSAEILSVSNDGTIRCGNVAAAVFDEVYVSKDWNTSSFDFLSEDGSTLLVSHWDGNVAIVDRRTQSNSGELNAHLGLNYLRMVSVHPLDRHYFATAAAQCATIYDIRNLKRSSAKAVAHMNPHSRRVNSAYFSPVTGNSVVTTSMDDMIRVFDTNSIIPEIPCVASITHNNDTGRWLTKFQAVWDPKKEDCFVVGSMVRPRQIDVFHSTGIKVHEFKHAEWLGSVCSINVMHPTKNVLVGGNSSGRLHVFMDNGLSG
ncbi:WD repeat-containing protein 76 [Amblyraja radiata]|uniref:WD repeat-containing protein 76 n=1 Tax=Amblyraja radiata TaxID=386614 RepID=UPI00140345ED|nr:WD repeat-containing protein 76 [Amblyraja radiata]